MFLTDQGEKGGGRINLFLTRNPINNVIPSLFWVIKELQFYKFFGLSSYTILEINGLK
jgi:hypothetical protein